MNQQRTPDDKEIVSARVRYAQREELAQGLAHLESQVGRVLWLHRLRKARFCYIFILTLSSPTSQIYALETTYLDDTNHVGNVVVGFENYARAGHNRHLTPKRPAADDERLFSLSSVTAKHHTALVDNGDDIKL